MQLLNSNSLEEHKYVQKGRLGRIHRYCPNLTRKDLVELDICNPKEDDDKYGVSIQLGYHILKYINTFFTQEEEIDVDAAFEIGASYIDKEIIYCYKMGRQDVVALKIKSNMFLNIEEDRAVWKAVRYDQKELLRQLLEAGFTPNDHYAEGGPVTSAVKRGKLDLLQLLLEYGADVNWEKLSLSLKELLKTAEAEGDPNINKIKALLATKNAPIDLVRLSPKS